MSKGKIIKELERFKNFIEEELGIEVDFDVAEFVDYLDEMGIDTLEEFVKSELEDLRIVPLRMDFEKLEMWIKVINVIGIGEDWKYNRILRFGVGNIINNVYNEKMEKIDRINVYELSQLYVLSKWYNLRDEFKERIDLMFR